MKILRMMLQRYNSMSQTSTIPFHCEMQNNTKFYTCFWNNWFYFAFLSVKNNELKLRARKQKHSTSYAFFIQLIESTSILTVFLKSLFSQLYRYLSNWDDIWNVLIFCTAVPLCYVKLNWSRFIMSLIFFRTHQKVIEFISFFSSNIIPILPTSIKVVNRIVFCIKGIRLSLLMLFHVLLPWFGSNCKKDNLIRFRLQ